MVSIWLCLPSFVSVTSWDKSGAGVASNSILVVDSWKRAEKSSKCDRGRPNCPSVFGLCKVNLVLAPWKLWIALDVPKNAQLKTKMSLMFIFNCVWFIELPLLLYNCVYVCVCVRMCVCTCVPACVRAFSSSTAPKRCTEMALEQAHQTVRLPTFTLAHTHELQMTSSQRTEIPGYTSHSSPVRDKDIHVCHNYCFRLPPSRLHTPWSSKPSLVLTKRTIVGSPTISKWSLIFAKIVLKNVFLWCWQNWFWC